jgi:hypothetical protein
MFRHMMSVVAALSVTALSNSPASADMSRGVIAAFHGQLVISKDELHEGKNDRDTIAKIKAAQLKELIGSPKADVTAWHFHYTAFVARNGATTLTMQFYTADKDHRYVADQRLDGIDPKSPVLRGDISIDEDEGLTKDKAYIIKLVTDKEAIVAQTEVVMK